MSTYPRDRRKFLKLAFAGCCLPALPRLGWADTVAYDRTTWYRNAKFGMFIHWGLYAVPAGTYDGKQLPGIGEWIMNELCKG